MLYLDWNWCLEFEDLCEFNNTLITKGGQVAFPTPP